MFSGVLDSLEQENLLLREKNVGLQEQVTLLEKALQNATQEKQMFKQPRTGEMHHYFDCMLIVYLLS